MKTTIRKYILTGVLAFTAVAATVPAHATLSGSAPRPEFSTASFFVSMVLSVFGY